MVEDLNSPQRIAAFVEIFRDEAALHTFRSSPPAFLTISAKRKTKDTNV